MTPNTTAVCGKGCGIQQINVLSIERETARFVTDGYVCQVILACGHGGRYAMSNKNIAAVRGR